MPYTATSWVDNVTLGNQTRMNNLETQYTEASQSHEPNLTTAYVEAGMVATKDGVTVNQLDVTGGTAWLLQADSTVRRRVTSASTPGQFTTSTINTTYFLDLNPDGTWSWGTAHSGVTNHLTICSATTDGSGNILVVSDARTLNTTLLPTLAGTLILPTLSGTPKWGGALGGSNKQMQQFLPSDGGDNWGLNYIFSDSSLSWFDATSSKTPLRLFTSGGIQTDSGAIATNGSGAFTKIGGQNAAGSFGAPVIVAQAALQVVAVTTAVTLITFSVPVNGLYRVTFGLSLNGTNASNTPRFRVTWTDPVGAQSASPVGQSTAAPAAWALLDGSSTYAAHWASVPIMPISVVANVGTMTITYTNAAATPSDTVSVMIERLV